MSLATQPRKEDPAWPVVEYLQRHGAATIKELEEFLGVTTTAVRQHLTGLQSAGYVARRTINNGVGRPHHTYSITPKAHELFACNCDDLALTLLEEVFVVEGHERAVMLLNRVGKRLADRYASSVKSPALKNRVGELAAALSQRGVLTDVLLQDDNTIVLKAYNCPYHELAQEHREICDMDENMMRVLLGSDVNLSACIMDGHAGCSFVVTSRDRDTRIVERADA